MVSRKKLYFIVCKPVRCFVRLHSTSLSNNVGLLGHQAVFLLSLTLWNSRFSQNMIRSLRSPGINGHHGRAWSIRDSYSVSTGFKSWLYNLLTHQRMFMVFISSLGKCEVYITNKVMAAVIYMFSSYLFANNLIIQCSMLRWYELL
jgi:hypothetical protein